MTQTPSNASLIDDALVAVREVIVRMDRHSDPALPMAIEPAPSTATLSASSEWAVEQVAIHHYLTSVSLLLDASLTLICQPMQRPSIERSRQWWSLIQQTKTAGRMVYGAALALADPGTTSPPTLTPAPGA